MEADWQVRKLGEFAERIRRVNEAGEELPPLSVTKDSGIMLQSDKFNKRIATDLRKYQIALRGEFVFDPMSLYYGAIGRVGVVERGAVSPDYVVFSHDRTVHGPFLEYLLRSPLLRDTFAKLAEGGNQLGKRRRVYWSVFSQIEARFPPTSEQQKIASILFSVDDTIEKAEAVIDELQTVKKAMMQEILTRGMPGRHSRFKASEIGELPAEWMVVPASEIFSSGPTNGVSPPSRSTPPGVPTFSIAAVRHGRVDVRSNLKYAAISPGEVARFEIKSGDVLIVRGNANPGLMGTCGVVDDVPLGCIYPDILMRVCVRPTMLRSFFVDTWNSDLVHGQLVLKAKTTNGAYKINQADVASVLVPVPPLAEQTEIAALFDAVERRIQGELAGLESLRMVKSALLSLLLTGEIRVTPDPEPTP